MPAEVAGMVNDIPYDSGDLRMAGTKKIVDIASNPIVKISWANVSAACVELARPIFFTEEESR
jgi:hypothetical protein